MIKKLLVSLFLLPLLSLAQSITVDIDTYTHEELITDILIGNNPCAVVENIASTTGTNFGFPSGIGYFENTNPNFPIESGIILATGDIMVSPYEAPPIGWRTTWGAGGWPG